MKLKLFFIAFAVWGLTLSASAQMTFTLNGITYGDAAQRDSKGFTTVTLPAGTNLNNLITSVAVNGSTVDASKVTPNPTTTKLNYGELKVFTYNNKAYGFRFEEDVWFCAVFFSDCHINQGSGHDGTSASDMTTIMNNIIAMGNDGTKKVTFTAAPNLVPKTSIIFCLGDVDQDKGDDGSSGSHDNFLGCTSALAKTAGIPFIFIAGNHDISPDYWNDGSKGVTYGNSGGYHADQQTIDAIKDNNSYWSSSFEDGITYITSGSGYDFEPSHFTFRFKDVRFYCSNCYWFQKPYKKPGLLSNTNGTMYAPDGIINNLNSFVDSHASEASVWMQHYPWLAGADCDRWWLDQNANGQNRASANSSAYGSDRDDFAYNDPEPAKTYKKNPLSAIMMKAAGKVDGKVQHFSGHYHRFYDATYTSTVNGDNKVRDYTVAANGNTEQTNNAFVVLFKRGEGVKEVIQTKF